VEFKALNFNKPFLMGIVNITPDSFSDGGKYIDPTVALTHINQLIAEGADIIDIGAESTFGPESQISVDEEISRLKPILDKLSDLNDLPLISIDTYKSKVAKFALETGIVDMINDVTALRGDSNMIDVLVKHKPYYCLMFSSYDTPYAGRETPHFDDIIATITDFLSAQTSKLVAAGFPHDRIIIDPGLGFFLSADSQVSWEVLNRLNELKILGFPILVGTSMKSYLGGPMESRLPRSLEAGELAIKNGANILRVHHTKEHRNLTKIHI
jgi:dihydropteroate synthase